MKASPVAVAIVLYLIAINQIVEACVCDKLKALLEQNAITGDVSSLIEGKTYQHVYIRKVFADNMKCSVTKYDLIQGSQIRATWAEQLNSLYISEETWKKTEKPNVFMVTGERKGDEPFTYNNNVYFFHADDYVIAQYACSPDSDYWRVLISVVNGNVNDLGIGDSLNAALAKVDVLKQSFTGPDDEKELTKLPQMDCPIL